MRPSENVDWRTFMIFMGTFHVFPKFISFPKFFMFFPNPENSSPNLKFANSRSFPQMKHHHPIIHNHPIQKSSPKVPDLRASDHLTDCPISYHHSCGLGLGHFQQWTLGGHVGPSGSSLGIASWPSCGTTLEALIWRKGWAKDGFHGF